MIVYGLEGVGSDTYTGKNWIVVSGGLFASDDTIALFWEEDIARKSFKACKTLNHNVTLLHGGKVIAQHKRKI